MLFLRLTSLYGYIRERTTGSDRRRRTNAVHKAGTAFKTISAIDLGKLCVAELLQRTNLEGKEVQALVFGTVIPSIVAPNIAREVSLLPQLPKGVQAFSVSRACASANQAITDAADQIALGHVDVAIAGGSESLSNIPILHSQGFAEALVMASKAKSMGGRLSALARLRPKDLVPITPAMPSLRPARRWGNRPRRWPSSTRFA